MRYGAREPCGLEKACQSCCPNGLNSLWDSIFKKIHVYWDNGTFHTVSTKRDNMPTVM